MKKAAICSAVLCLLGFCASAGSPFNLIKIGNYQNGELLSPASGSITMKMKTASKNNYLVAYSNVKQEITAQKKLMFRLCGNPALGAGAHLTPAIAYTVPGERKWHQAIGAGIPLTNGEFRSFTLGFDTDFKLSDSKYTLRQIKFVINGGNLPPGTPMEVKITNIQVGDAADSGSSALTVTVPPLPVYPEKGTVKIFFELENDDHSAGIPSRFIKNYLKEGEPRVPAGFSDLILENTAGIFSETDSISKADVIVYARLTPGKNGKAIADALKAGKKLIASGMIPDAEVAALSPLELKENVSKGFPKRSALKFNDPELEKSLSQKNNAFFAEYFTSKIRQGGRLLIAHSGGTPYLAERRNFYHFAGTLGNTVEKSDVFFDKLLLRLCAGKEKQHLLDEREKALVSLQEDMEKSLVAAAVQEIGCSPDNWKLGASRQNFSRFGWRIGVGLGCGTLNNDLSFSNGDQSFKLSSLSADAVLLDKWKLKPLDSAVILPAKANVLSQWSGEGRTEYTTKIIVPEAWKGRQIAFEVSSGIDDVDDFYFNGELAGQTTVEVPEYWMTPRNYRLDPAKIRFGKTNTIKIVVRNLRGNAGVLSMPRLTAKIPGSSPSVSVTSLNWSGRVCKISDKNSSYEVHQTLLLPMLRHVFNDEKEVVLQLENIAEFAAWKDASGKLRSIALKKSPEEFYNSKRDGKLGAPFLLLYRSGTGKPLLLVFDRQINYVKSVIRNGSVSSLRIGLKKGKNNIIAGFPCGAAAVSGKGLPEKAMPQIDQLVTFSLNWPTIANEFYRIDRAENKIHFINHFNLEYIPNEWKIPQTKYAFLPPLTALLIRQKFYAEAAGEYTDFRMPTVWGPTLGVTGKAAVRFASPLPGRADFQIPGIVSEKENRLQNEFFADGVRWSCGGATPVSAWSPKRPNGNIAGKNIDLFSWNFGLNSALQGLFFLNDANREKLTERISGRFLEPVEKYKWKSVYRHRYEPFSGITYPVLIQSYHKLPTAFAPGAASSVTFADANEALTVVQWLVQQLEDLAGQQGLAAANWNYLRYLARYELAIDDYAFQSGSCRDFGTGAWIDMLNCEYGGMMAYARNAELAGDEKTADEALYRAARRAIPTLARFRFREYLNKLEPARKKENIQVTGFWENGAKYMLYPAGNFNFLSAMDLYDFSEGFMGTMIRLYCRYVEKENKEHVLKRAYPSLLAAPSRSYAYLPVLALYLDEKSMAEYAAKSCAENRRMGDWPGMRRAFEIGSVLWRKHGRITFRDFRCLDVQKALFDPAAAELVLEYTARDGAALKLESDFKVSEVHISGKKVVPVLNGNILTLPSAPGKYSVKVYFRKENTK